MKLTIRFAGICTHFLNGTAAGVPHRVVLPDAAKIFVGKLAVSDLPPGETVQAWYYLLPHFPQLEVPGATAPLSVQNLIDQGDILSGVRLQLRNPVDSPLLYERFFAPRLTDFNPDYTPSGDVVLGGRAACYFDLYGGQVSSTIVNDAWQTVVTIDTVGAPELVVTPLARSDTPVQPTILSLNLPESATEAVLIVKNLEPKPEELSGDNPDEGAFDFLWHYLTSHGGIPPEIKRMTPGMNAAGFKSATTEEFASALRAIADMLAPPAARPRELIQPLEVTPSCSDSQYP